MEGKLSFIVFFILAAVTFTNAAYLLPDPTILFKHCVGPACPTYSLPMRMERPGSHHSMNCSKGDIIPDPLECQSFYLCNRDGSGIKMMCTFGYAFHPRIKRCVPESLVKSCGKVYCPPSVLVGTVPDPGNCTRYYRCVYGTTLHYQCEPGFVYDEELGTCLEHGESVPVCISGGENNSLGNTTTESVLITSPSVPDVSTEHIPTTSTPVTELSTEQTITTTTVVTDLSSANVVTEEPGSIPTSTEAPTSTLLITEN